LASGKLTDLREFQSEKEHREELKKKMDDASRQTVASLAAAYSIVAGLPIVAIGL
jgi:hypothetical protein